MRFKRENISENVRSSEKFTGVTGGEATSNDLRGTIKKESGEIRELKLKLDMVSKQCKMYEEIIDKMDERIKKLVQDQHKKAIELDEQRQELSKIDQLKDKTNSLMRLYNELESKFNSDQLEWMKWKQNWLSEK
jgi:chromosome segregation ATPase